MPPVLSTRNVLDHAPARSVRLGLKPPGLGLTTGCCSVSSSHRGTLLIVLGRRKPEHERGQNCLQLRPLLFLSVAGPVHAVQGPLRRAPLPRGPLQRSLHQRALLRREPLLLSLPRAPLRRAPLAGTATAGTATAAGTATVAAVTTTLGSFHDTVASSVSAGTASGRGVTAVRRSARKRTPVSPSKDTSPKKKKTKSSSVSTTSSRKKGGAVKGLSKDLAPQGPVTRSGAPRRSAMPSAAAGTAPAASTVFLADTSGSQALKPKTPTKAALKSYDSSFVLRDPLMPHLEDDPLGGDPFDRPFWPRFG